MKIRKEDSPTRPKMYWMNAAAYKLAEHLLRILEQHVPLPHSINVRDTVSLLADTKDIKYHKNMRLVSFDIKNK
jgi:hypothetical protein